MHLHFIYYELDIRCWPRCFFSRFLHLKKYCWVDKNLYWSKRWVNLAEHMQLHREFVATWKLRKKKGTLTTISELKSWSCSTILRQIKETKETHYNLSYSNILFLRLTVCDNAWRTTSIVLLYTLKNVRSIQLMMTG